MTNKERYFVNPYPDYGKRADCSIHDLIDVEFWKNWALENGLICLKKSKPKADEKYCDGSIYVGNIGLEFTSFKLLKSGYFDKHENDLKKYMIDCLKANENYYSSYSQRDSEKAAFLLGKGDFFKYFLAFL